MKFWQISLSRIEEVKLMFILNSVTLLQNSMAGLLQGCHLIGCL